MGETTFNTLFVWSVANDRAAVERFLTDNADTKQCTVPHACKIAFLMRASNTSVPRLTSSGTSECDHAPKVLPAEVCELIFAFACCLEIHYPLEMEHAMPVLARLGHDSISTTEWIMENWGRPWGLYMKSIDLSGIDLTHTNIEMRWQPEEPRFHSVFRRRSPEEVCARPAGMVKDAPSLRYDFDSDEDPPSAWLEDVAAAYPELHFELRCSDQHEVDSELMRHEGGVLMAEELGAYGDFHRSSMWDPEDEDEEEGEEVARNRRETALVCARLRSTMD